MIASLPVGLMSDQEFVEDREKTTLDDRCLFHVPILWVVCCTGKK
jgi:hypothetical protein